MDHSTHNKIVSFIWSIADDCLRDVFVRGKYRDVILPMFVLRRLDCLLEPTKEAVLEEVKFQRTDVGLTELDPKGLCEASGYVFYNTSQFTLKSLLGNPSQLEANFKTYLDGFSANVKEIIENFDLRNQVRKMVAADVLYDVIEKYVSEEINLSPEDKRTADGRLLAGLSNLGMGYVFEELIRKFNEENNEEAGEHFTPREVIKLMTHILFEPVKNQLPPVMTIYDPACGSGGMLTEAQNFIIDPEGGIKSTADVYVYGKEVNPETFAICKSDMMIKGNNPENIKLGSTLATDEFSAMKFDFMLSNPPYGKSWKSDLKYIKDGKDVIDSRFQVRLKNFAGEDEMADATPRSSDGQLLFLMEMAGKMRNLANSPQGSRIASVHNGSSLFTGDAGGGESNIRRFIIENDYLEAIIQLPNNMFYNTGITTYIWILCNNKPAHRRGKVQLINASEMYQKLRKNLGQKNCEFTDAHIDEITRIYLDMKDEGVSKLFDNEDFGYYKVTVERPLRKSAQFTPERVASLRFASAMQEVMEWMFEKYEDEVYTNIKSHKQVIEDYLEREEISITPKNKKALLSEKTWIEQRDLMQTAEKLMGIIGQDVWNDFNTFSEKFEATLKAQKIKLSASEKNQILNAISWRDEKAEKVIKKQHKLAGAKLEELLEKLGTEKQHLADYGYWPTGKDGEYLEYETDSDLRDTENVPLKEDIHDYFLSEVRPHVDEAWLDIGKTTIGYEISFNRYFYQHQPLRSLDDVTRDILQLEEETEGLLKKLVDLTSATPKSEAA
ncbi:MAG: class I SAM-dependent DNA methyltransferase [Rickettsiales bacterium]